MMKYALIESSGRIAQIENIPDRGDVPFPVAPELKWVKVPDDTTDRDLHVEGKIKKFIEPAKPTTLLPAADKLSALAQAFGFTSASELKSELNKIK